MSDQQGQDTVELAGLLVLIAAIVGAVVALGLPGRVGHAVECAVNQILQIGICQARPAYPVAQFTKTVGYNGRVAIGDGEHQYVVTMTEMSDGKTLINIANVKQGGVSLQVGANVSAGPLVDAGATAGIGGGGLVSDSTTFTAPDWATGLQEFKKIGSSSGGSLLLHDLGSGLPFGLGHVADHLDGGQGAPGPSSLPHNQLSSHSVGLGVYASGSAQADAHVQGVGGGGAGVSANAQITASRIDYGAQKGDKQYQISLGGAGDATLATSLFGGKQASGAASLQGSATVTVSPSGKPLQLVVDASGQGVWSAGPSSDKHASLPGTDKSDPSPGGKTSAVSHAEPALELNSNTAGGSGGGAEFQATLDLTNNPSAASDVQALLHLNLTKIPAVVDDMNKSGTEQVQTFHAQQSNSSFDVQGNFGVGLGAGLTNASSRECVQSIQVRQAGGSWSTVPFQAAPGC